MSRSQIVSAVRQVEALVAEREVRDLLIAERHREAGPVVERGIDDLVRRELSILAGDRHVADLAAPSFDERYAESIRRHRAARCSDLSSGQRLQLRLDESGGALDL